MRPEKFAKEISKLNPWVVPFIALTTDGSGSKIPILVGGRRAAPRIYEIQERQFREVRKAAHVARSRKGHNTWNSWSDEMLGVLEDLSSDTKFRGIWEELAAFEARDTTFQEDFDFAAFHFPGRLILAGSTFEDGVFFNAARIGGAADFSRVIFCKDAVFENCTFAGPTLFRNSNWRKTAECRSMHAENSIDVSGAHFFSDAWIVGSRFDGKATFRNTRFDKTAALSGCAFNQEADFTGAVFEGELGLQATVFKATAEFDGSELRGRVFSRNLRAAAPHALPPSIQPDAHQSHIISVLGRLSLFRGQR